MTKLTYLLPDLPVEEDEFGPHAKLAAEVERLICQRPNEAEHVPHAIALLGDWGSGKSSVVRMLRANLKRVPWPDKKTRDRDYVQTFVYDAWANEGDGLRRAFLDNIREQFDPIFTTDEREAVRKGVWDQHETTTTTKQPVLRRHGKLLLLSLVLVPAGLRLFGAYPDHWDATKEWAWNLVTLLAIFAPIALAGLLYLAKKIAPLFIKRWLFGVKSQEELEDVRITSVFFQKIEGEIEHHWVTNPTDSIQQFRGAFSEVCRIALGDSGRLLLVVDNLDRLERDEARAFWSTMQSFFDRTGWIKNGLAERIWLLVPFSSVAVERLFSDERTGMSSSEAKAFVDKSFDLSLIVPPPIQVDSRRYMLGQLEKAFPDHSSYVRENVRDLFDRNRTGGRATGLAGDARATRKTPREMKLFINQLVALYRVQGDEPSLEAMAAYLLTRDVIAQDGIDPKSQLSPYQLSILPAQPDWTQQIASVHFGVDLATAAQVVLSDPIQAALQASDPARLRLLSSRSGFVDVLQNVVTEVGTNSVAGVLDKVAIIGEVDGADSSAFNATWSILTRELSTVDRFGEIAAQHVDGLGRLYDLLPDLLRAELLDIVRAGLERTWTTLSRISQKTADETDEAFEKRMASAKSWGIIQQKFWALSGQSSAPVRVPFNAGYAVRILDELSADGVVTSKSINVRSIGDAAAKAIISWPGVDVGPTNPIAFTRLIKSLDGWRLPWDNVVQALSLRMSTELSPSTALKTLTMLFAIAAVMQTASSKAAIVEIVGNGELDSTVEAAGSSLEANALALAMIILFAPTTSPQAAPVRNRVVESNLVAVLAGEADEETVHRAAALISEVFLGSSAFGTIIQYPGLHNLGARILSKLIEDRYSFNPTIKDISKWYSFIDGLISKDNQQKFVENLGNIEKLLDDLSETKLTEESAPLALWFLSTKKGKQHKKLRSKIISYLKAIDSSTWTKALESKNNDILLEMAGKIHDLGIKLSIGVNISDAMTAALRPVSIAQVDVRKMRQRYNFSYEIMVEDIKGNLPPRLWDVVNNIDTQPDIDNAIAVAGELLLAVGGVNPSSAVNSTLKNLLVDPKLATIEWLSRLLAANPDWLASAPSAAAELRARINEKLRITSGVDSETKRALRLARNLLPTEDKPKRSSKRVRS